MQFQYHPDVANATISMNEISTTELSVANSALEEFGSSPNYSSAWGPVGGGNTSTAVNSSTYEEFIEYVYYTSILGYQEPNSRGILLWFDFIK